MSQSINTSNNATQTTAINSTNGSGNASGIEQKKTPITGVAETPLNTSQTRMDTPSPQMHNVGGTAKTPEQKAALLKSPQARLGSAADACREIAKNEGSSPEAKAVYGTLADILNNVGFNLNGDYRVGNIQNKLSPAITKHQEKVKGGNEKSEATVGMFDAAKDNPGSTGKPSTWGNEMSSIEICEELRIPQKEVGLYPQNHRKEGPVNIGNKTVGITSDDFKKDERTGGTIFEGEGFSIRCDSGLDPSKYLKQFNNQVNTFSGDIHVHKLEPGTVLVRVYGQDQRTKSPCWCRLDDPTSSVTNPEDLLKKLAVCPDWNGDGNLAIMIVPEDYEVVVAEGKIAEQKGQYTESIINADFKNTSEFVFPGGGTQLNIMTHDNPNVKYPPFANDEKGILDGCIFNFRDTNLACPSNVL